VLLQQYHQQLLLLHRRWSTPFVSDIRFKFHLTQATSVAKRLSGATPSTELRWITPQYCTVPDVEPESSSGEAEQPAEFDTDISLISDVFVDGEDIPTTQDDIDAEARIDNAHADIVWVVPVRFVSISDGFV
jgi:hypothetical protein